MTDTDNHTKSYYALRAEKERFSKHSYELIGEEPLLIRIDEKPYSVVMRTPGEELSHAAGFCLGEGIVDTTDDFMTMGHCKDLDPNVIDIRLKPERRAAIRDLLGRRGFVSQTSCGICGKEMIKDIYQNVTPSADTFQMPMDQLLASIEQLSKNQNYYQRTKGSHAAMLFNRQREIISFAEDVGRHNAIDKAIGKVFLSGTLPEAVLVTLTSRISYELVQKTARARLSIMASLSRPTALATEMARDLNITIACKNKVSGLTIFSGEHRIVA